MTGASSAFDALAALAPSGTRVASDAANRARFRCVASRVFVRAVANPSAAICANALAREVDFFSIGTNDLIQYALAVDRVNEKVAYLYEPTHPAIVRLLKMVADAAHANHIWVGVCGEMAGDVALVPLLLGLGMDELSAAATLVPRVKRAVQSLTIPDCRELVDETLKLNTASEILERCLQLADSRYGDLLG